MKNSIALLEVENDSKEKLERVDAKINLELDRIGISRELKGRSYMRDALVCMFGLDEHYNQQMKQNPITPFYYVARKYKVDKSTISRVIQTAINSAWKVTKPSELSVLYTAKYDVDIGVPSVTDFVYYYRDKIKEEL